MLRVILAVLVSFALVACRDPAPNVVLITLDGTRADQLGIYGNEGTRTPNFDRFARDAVLYEQAYSTSSASLSSHASLLTGLHPMQHGARARLAVNSATGQMQGLSDRATTLAEHLRLLGHRTAAFVANPELRREFGVAQGFEHFDDTLAESGASGTVEAGQNAKRIADLAIERLEAFGEESFLLFVNFFDSRTSNDVTVVEFDVQLGRLLTALDASPRGDETLIAITADSGGKSGGNSGGKSGRKREDRGDASQDSNLYEEAVRVPLVLRYPVGARGSGGLEPGTRVDTATQNHRLFATILETVGIAQPEEVKLHPLGGRDTLIFTELRRRASETPGDEDRPRDFRAIYLFPFKLIQTRSGHSEFYNLDRDPKEAHSIVTEAPKAYSRLLKLLIQFGEAHPPLFEDEPYSNVWPASVAKLNALGTVE